MTDEQARRQGTTAKALSEALAGGQTALEEILGRYSANPDPERFGDDLFSLLEGLHETAVTLGRHRGGDLTPPEPDDRAFAQDVLRGEDTFLAAFQEDLARGRYDSREDGTPRMGAIRQRAKMYLDRVRGTANEVWALTTGGLFYWEYDPEAENCSDCLELEAHSPYLWNNLPTYPRQGMTLCRTSCRCLLKAQDGSESFP